MALFCIKTSTGPIDVQLTFFNNNHGLNLSLKMHLNLPAYILPKKFAIQVLFSLLILLLDQCHCPPDNIF